MNEKTEEGQKTEEQGQEQKEEEQRQDETLIGILKKFPNAPSPAQIEQWKILHGEIFVSGFSETELFIFKPVKRNEWVNLQTMIANSQQTPNPIEQFQAEEMVCNTCLLWKSINTPWGEYKAGTLSVLQEQILQRSNFLTPQAAQMLVAKL